MKKTYIVTVEKIGCADQDSSANCKNILNIVYRIVTGIVYACYAVVFLLPIVGADRKWNVIALWMACFSLITAAAYSDIPCFYFMRRCAPDTASKTFTLMFMSLIIAGLLYCASPQPLNELITEKGTDAMTWLSIMLFFRSQIARQRKSSLTAKG